MHSNVTVDMCYSKMTNSCLDVDLLQHYLTSGEPSSSTSSIFHQPDNKKILHSNVLQHTTWLLESSALTSLARLTFAIKEIQTSSQHKTEIRVPLAVISAVSMKIWVDGILTAKNLPLHKSCHWEWWEVGRGEYTWRPSRAKLRRSRYTSCFVWNEIDR